MTPIIEILIVTFKRDFPYLHYWLRGAEKNVRGIDRINIVVPDHDVEQLKQMFIEMPHDGGALESGVTYRYLGGNEWPGLGFNWHQAQHMRADEFCPEADVIVHTDPDRPFIHPFGPDDVVRDGKPLIVHGSYQWLRERVQANLDMWRDGVRCAIGIDPPQEVMRRMPIPHLRETHAETRQMVEDFNKMPFDEYVKAQRNEFPQGISEFNTLGAVAWEKFHDRYHWLDQEKGEYPPDKVVNGWAQSGMRAEDEAKCREAGL